jgi:hypothetical protein
MKIIIAICVHDRFQNIVEWINCWQQSNTQNAELIIIQNHYNDLILKKKFEDYCNEHSIKYIGCNRSGFDIARLQDVSRERLEGFPNDWDYLLWVCDDTIPMQKDFITPFIDKFQNQKIGCAAMEISPSVSMHVRTTGFCIKKEVANKLTFPADPITTKHHCYLWEHRDKKTFYNQIVSMGLIPIQVAPAKVSPLWDTGYWRRLDRQKEHDAIFNIGKVQNDKVVFIVPIYNMYPAIISSLICQTFKNWELLLIHNGPEVNGLDKIVKGYNDPRVKFIINPVETGNYGHPLRQWALKQDELLKDAAYIVIQNADNYLMPPYTEYLLKGFTKSHTAVATYCSDTVHSYKNWQILPAKLALGFIDCGSVMVKKDVACEVGWRSFEHSSDWTYFSDIAAKYNFRNFIKINGVLCVHNVIIFIIFISSLFSDV